MNRTKREWVLLISALMLLGVYIALGVHYDKSAGQPKSFPVFAEVSNWLDEKMESWYVSKRDAG